MTISVDHFGIQFEVEAELDMGYQETMLDPGLAPDIEVTSIKHEGTDMYEVLSDSAISSIIESACEQAIERHREAV